MVSSESPIFILGMLPRSGTNYLARMLALHPDCKLSSVPEDWLVADSDHLSSYASALGRKWHSVPSWDVSCDAEDELLRRMGDSMVSFLCVRSNIKSGQRLITKTPSVDGLSNFFRMFPDAYLLVLVRDGRSVVESTVRSFGESPAKVAQCWRDAADKILAFDRKNQGKNHRYRLIRYEALVHDPRGKITEILDFIGLDAGSYKYSRVEDLPVFGSSTSVKRSGKWSWQISSGSKNLGSVERWSKWSRAQHERFNWAAEYQLQDMGYQAISFDDHKYFWGGVKRAWTLAATSRRVFQRLLFSLHGRH